MKIEIGSGSPSRFGGKSAGGKGCLTIFFLVFLLMGGAFTYFILGETARQAAVWFWPEAPCTILASGVEETGNDSDPYQPSIHFEYQIDGRDYQGRKVSRGDISTSSYDKARRPSDRYPPGSRATCRVNPDSPGDAVLEHRLPWIGLVVFLPLMFVAVGIGGIYAVWKGVPKLGSSIRPESISQRARQGKQLGRKIELGVGLVFAAVGGSLSVFLLILPAARLLSATTWEERPATVKASMVRSWSTDDGISHSADVLYEYEIDGRRWISNRRTFFPMSSSGYLDTKAVVDLYSAGSETTCYVDADDPTRSVLDRSIRPVYLIGLFPLVFLLAGLGLTIHALRTRSASVPGSPGSADHTETYAAERVLEPEAGPIAKIVGMLLVAVLWNGIVSIFLWQAVKAVQSGSPEWFLMIFLIPFVLVGLGLVIGFFYTILAAFNPRPSLIVTPATARLGTRLRVNWSFRGEVSRISHFKIVLEGHEKATYRRGTDTYTDRETFASIDLVDSSAEWEIRNGSAEVEIPEDTMHSFSSANNGVIWSLIVQGEIPRWPDVSETFEIEVRPLSRERLLP